LTSYSAVSPTLNGTDIWLSACTTLVAATVAVVSGPADVGVWAAARSATESPAAIAILMSAEGVT
jgi:hypothetical protein